MINDNIRKYRKEKGISQEEMAVRLHVVRQTVSKWEIGAGCGSIDRDSGGNLISVLPEEDAWEDWVKKTSQSSSGR